MDGRTKQHSLTLMHKIVNKIAPGYLTEKLSHRHEVHNHNTRNRHALNTRRLHNARKKDAFFVKTVNDYNTFNQNHVFELGDSINCFKNKINKHLKNLQVS